MRISDWSSDVCSSDLRLVDRAEGEMVILRLQPREQIARNGRQSAREPTGAVGGKLKAQEIAEHGRHGGSSESDQCSYYVLSGCASRIVPARACLAWPENTRYDLSVSPRSEEHTSELQSLMRNS